MHPLQDSRSIRANGNDEGGEAGNPLRWIVLSVVPVLRGRCTNGDFPAEPAEEVTNLSR